jgi:hypothetical protein
MHRIIVIGRGLVGSAAGRHLSELTDAVVVLGPVDQASIGRGRRYRHRLGRSVGADLYFHVASACRFRSSGGHRPPRAHDDRVEPRRRSARTDHAEGGQ